MGDCTPCVRIAHDNSTTESMHKTKKFVGFPSISSQLANSAICKHISNKDLLSTPIIQCLNQRGQLNKSTSIDLIFRASEHKFSSQKFHEVCEGFKNTLLLILSENNRVFGAFTPCEWRDNSEMHNYQKDPKRMSFIFRIFNNQIDIYQLRRQATNKAIMNDCDLGPVFGEGHDLIIHDKCNIHENWSNIGKSYDSPFLFGSRKANALLCGQEKFKIKEYELWQLTKDEGY